MSDYIVTVTPTIMDGLVVRWYRSEAAALEGNEVLSASRNGVLVHGYMHEVSQDSLAAANKAHDLLLARTRTNDETVKAYFATHEIPFGRRELIPVTP